jgi:hypothetical protein
MVENEVLECVVSAISITVSDEETLLDPHTEMYYISIYISTYCSNYLSIILQVG